MTAPYVGGCQCGAIRYTIQAEPLTVYTCHCTECQKQSSSAFGMSMIVRRDSVRFDQGQPKAFRRMSDSGNEVICTFCPDCGTRLFHEIALRTEVMNLKPGTLDDTTWLDPVGHVWTGSAQPWMTFEDDVLIYEAQPETFDPLIARWQELRA